MVATFGPVKTVGARRSRRAGLLGLSLLCATSLGPAPAGAASAAGPEVQVRTGSYAGFGRVAFQFPAIVQYQLVRDGDRILLHFEDAGVIPPAASFPRNVLGIIGGNSEAEILVEPGTRVQQRRIGAEVVIDLLDRYSPRPAPAAPVATPASPAPNAAASADHPPATDRNAAPAASEAPTAPVPSATPTASEAPTVSPASHSPVAPETSAAIEATLAAATPPATNPPAITALASPPEPAASPAHATAPETAAAPVSRVAEEHPQAAATSAPVAAGRDPVALAASRAPLPVGVTGSAITLPFARTTGLAAFRRGASVLLVFDERRPIDLGAFRDDPVFGTATVQLLPNATVVRLRPPPATELVMRRNRDGWVATLAAAAANPSAIEPRLVDRQLVIAAAMAGQVVNVADPDSGGLLLVGTMREPGQAVTVARRTSEFILLPTFQGVVLEPLADSIFLRGTKEGFVLGAEPSGLALAPARADDTAFAQAAALTRRFDFPPLPSDALGRRLQAEIDAVAAAPPLSRGRKRREAAQTMLALGLGAEAEALLRLAAIEDAREVDNPDAIGLRAIAAILAGRENNVEGLADPRLTGTDEVALWRAVRDATRREGSPEAAPVFAATMPLLLSYPSELRNRLLPLAAETMAINQTAGTAKLLAARPDDPGLSLARGIWQVGQGERDAALATFDRVAAGPDRLDRVRAATRAIELRLASGLIDARQAADALGGQIYAWRGDRRELALRLRIAELRMQSGGWRAALAMLRETETLWPDQHDAVHAKLQAAFATLMGEGNADRLAPLDLVALVEENADLLPDGTPSGDMAARVADRLLALDLPKRAEPLLDKLAQTSSGAARAQFGARLATLRLRADDAVGALAALSSSAGEQLPADLTQRRVLVQARATARIGNAAAAVELLAGLGTAEADEARAGILEAAKDWRQAAGAMADYAGKTVPPEGMLNDAQQRTLLRLAGDMAQSGDVAALESLRQRESARMAAGPISDMFRLLTASPVQHSTDLPRAGREIALARGVPNGLRAMEPPPREAGGETR